MTKAKTLYQEFGIGGQYVTLTEAVQVGTDTLQVTVKRDSYDMQSYARVDRWDGTQWHQVAVIHYSQMVACRTAVNGSKAVNPYDPEHHRAAVLMPDRDELIRRACLIVGKGGM